MYRVFLVDDEQIIVEGLKKVVPWEKYGCTVCGTATNGKEGLEEIRRQKPDILFTDICMPEMNGLLMVAGLKSELPNMQIAVLTGYHDFAYAQEAVRLGVSRLLTKPSKMEEINEAIVAMTYKLDHLQEERPEEVEQGEQGQTNFVIQQALNYLDEHYAEKVTLQEVAAYCCISQWHLSKVLNKHTQKTYYEWLNTIRVRHAKRLLSEPGMKIADISEAVGYADPGHFCRIFKSIEGVSAAEYRNSLGAKKRE